jgi:hypothetical protein
MHVGAASGIWQLSCPVVRHDRDGTIVISEGRLAISISAGTAVRQKNLKIFKLIALPVESRLGTGKFYSNLRSHPLLHSTLSAHVSDSCREGLRAYDG